MVEISPVTTFTMTRQIGIDAGHRIPDHGSKCFNMHGHRYTIEATCEGENLISEGEQKGMLLDFGFLKEEMMHEIDRPCDHGMIFSVHDPFLEHLFRFLNERWVRTPPAAWQKWQQHAVDVVNDVGYYAIVNNQGKFYLIDSSPTAENLAAHWFERLAPRVSERSHKHAKLVKVKVWETPNCFAEFILGNETA